MTRTVCAVPASVKPAAMVAVAAAATTATTAAGRWLLTCAKAAPVTTMLLVPQIGFSLGTVTLDLVYCCLALVQILRRLPDRPDSAQNLRFRVTSDPRPAVLTFDAYTEPVSKLLRLTMAVFLESKGLTLVSSPEHLVKF